VNDLEGLSRSSELPLIDRPFNPKVIIRSHSHTVAQPGPLNWSVIVLNRVCDRYCCSSEVSEKDSSTAVDGQRTGGRADSAGRRGWHGGGRRRDDDGGGGDDQGASDADTVEDSLVGDSDENGRGRPRPPRGHRHGHQRPGRGHRPRHAPSTSSYRIFIALFDYNPTTMSPNRDAIDDELAFYEGQLLKVSTLSLFLCFFGV